VTKLSKPISAGDWVFWYSGLFKVVSVGEIDTRHFPENKHKLKTIQQMRAYYNEDVNAPILVYELEPINVPAHVLRWYNTEFKDHGGVFVRFKRVNPLSAEKRGYIKGFRNRRTGT
jgi:hypothetical protein